MSSSKTADALIEDGRALTLIADKKRLLLGMIADAYSRMATNRSPLYREMQMDKINKWLEELTTMHEKNPQLWSSVT